MRVIAAILSVAGAIYSLEALLATFGTGVPEAKGPTRVLLGLATAGCLWLLFRFLEGSRAADMRALDERASSRE